MRIYTKTGDDGSTGLIGGARVAKDDAVIACVGCLDELNASIGWVRSAAQEWPLNFVLQRVQGLLFEVGAEIASPVGHSRSHTAVLGTIVEDLERSIDLQDKLLPKLTQFVIPGGSELASRVHIARGICRRAERNLVALSHNMAVRPEILAFVNRLSDWMFLAARTANSDAGVPEPLWTKSDQPC